MSNDMLISPGLDGCNELISTICTAVWVENSFMVFHKAIPLLHRKTSCRKKRNPRRPSRERGYLVRLRVKRPMWDTRPDIETCFLAHVFFFHKYSPWFSTSLDKQTVFRGIYAVLLSFGEIVCSQWRGRIPIAFLAWFIACWILNQLHQVVHQLHIVLFAHYMLVPSSTYKHIIYPFSHLQSFKLHVLPHQCLLQTTTFSLIFV